MIWIALLSYCVGLLAFSLFYGWLLNRTETPESHEDVVCCLLWPGSVVLLLVYILHEKWGGRRP